MTDHITTAAQPAPDEILGILEDEVYCDKFDGSYDYGDAVPRILSLFAAQPPAAPVETKEQRENSCTGLCKDGSGEGCNCSPAAHQRSSAASSAADIEDVADIIRDKVYADENDKIGGAYDAAQKIIEYIAALTPTEPQASSAGSELADWSSLPRDLYVTSVKCTDGIVFDVQCCSVPMAIGPEVRYSQVIPGEPQAAPKRLVTDWEDVEQLTNVSTWCESCQTNHWSGACDPDLEEQRGGSSTLSRPERATASAPDVSTPAQRPHE